MNNNLSFNIPFNRTITDKELIFWQSFINAIPLDFIPKLYSFRKNYETGNSLSIIEKDYFSYKNEKIEERISQGDYLDYFNSSINAFDEVIPNMSKTQKFALFINTLGLDDKLNFWTFDINNKGINIKPIFNIPNFQKSLPHEILSKQLSYFNFITSEFIFYLLPEYNEKPFFIDGNFKYQDKINDIIHHHEITICANSSQHSISYFNKEQNTYHNENAFYSFSYKERNSLGISYTIPSIPNLFVLQKFIFDKLFIENEYNQLQKNIPLLEKINKSNRIKL